MEALHGADALAIVTEWQEFRSPDFDTIKAELAAPGDLRRPQPVRPRVRASVSGSKYYAIGRGDSRMLIPVILSGGSGTRLWPLSRELYPKQLLPLVGKGTMLQETLARLAGVPDVGAPLVVCNESHRFLVAEQLLERGTQAASDPARAGRTQHRARRGDRCDGGSCRCAAGQGAQPIRCC